MPDLGVTNSSQGLLPPTIGEPGRGILRGSTSIGIEVGFLAPGGGGFLACHGGFFVIDLHEIFPAAS